MVNSVSGANKTDYNAWVQSLNSRGIKTTSLGKGEANFSDYTNALSESLKQEIMASFDNDADYALQSKLASLYGGKSVKQSGDIVSLAKANGINVSVQYVPTTYIVDNKADGHYDTDVTKGSIAVYTFSDGKGGEIKIADANGNGALETEELFMNEILSGVVSDIKPGSAGNVSETQSNMQAQTSSYQDSLNAQMQEYQKFIEEQMARIQQLQQEINEQKAALEEDTQTTTTDNTSNQATVETKTTEAKSLIRKKYKNVSSSDIKNIASSAAKKAIESGMSVAQALKEILGEPESKKDEE